MNAKTRVFAALGNHPVDTLFTNAKLVNVFTGEIDSTDVAVHGGVVVGYGHYDAKETIDLKGAYLAPGFIDGHVHIESSMLTPGEFARVVVPKGTTTVIADPHEIANVIGLDGIRYMLNASENIPLNVRIMVPSCVPATSFENAGASIDANDIASIKDHPRVLGLGEVMDYPAVMQGDDAMFDKLAVMHGKPIDGHAPDILGKELSAYAAAGVQTDHECTKTESLIERIRRGMYVHLREGSATRNTRELLKAVTEENYHRLLFCTDDKHPEDIVAEGHINHNVNLAIKAGVKPMHAIRMGTLNAAACYGLHDVGALGIGYRADMIVFDNLTTITPRDVYKDGKRVVKDGVATFTITPYKENAVTQSVNVHRDTLDFRLPLKGDKARVIGIIQNNITTRHEIRQVPVKDGEYVHNRQSGLNKLAVIERHRHTGNVGVGLVSGYDIENGALAMTIAHDSHNLIVIGDNDHAMRLAAERIIDMQGGIVLVQGEDVVDALPLDIAGIMSSKSAEHVAETLTRIGKKARSMGLNEAIDDPFITLAFLSLPVIPELKLTDRGLFDVASFKHVAIEPESEDS